ncbi:MAG TPA: GatB/YqeY domain-containing protein, partial [Candidatus Limnocylindrales bacterium]
MTLRERLHDDTTAAMRSRDSLRRDTLRMVQDAIYKTEKAKRVTLSEDELLGVITREVKTR